MSKNSFSPNFKLGQKGTLSRPVIIIGGIVVLAIIFFIAIGALKINVTGKKSDVATEPKVYTNEAKGFSLTYPGNWIVQENPNYVGFYSTKENSSDAFVENVIVSADDVESQQPGITLDQVVDSWVRQNRADLGAGAVMSEATATTVNSIPAQTVTYSQTSQGIRVKGTAIITLQDGIAYVFIYTAEERAYDMFVNGFEMVTSSLQIQ